MSTPRVIQVDTFFLITLKKSQVQVDQRPHIKPETLNLKKKNGELS